MLKKANALYIALLAFPLIFTGCQPQEPAPVSVPEPMPAPEPAPTSPYLTKVYKDGSLSKEYVYEGVRPVKMLTYNRSGQVIRTESIFYNGAGKVSLVEVRSINPDLEEN